MEALAAQILKGTFGQFVEELRRREGSRLRGIALFGKALDFDMSWILLKEKRVPGGARMPLRDMPVPQVIRIDSVTFKKVPNVGDAGIAILRAKFEECGITNAIPDP